MGLSPTGGAGGGFKQKIHANTILEILYCYNVLSEKANSVCLLYLPLHNNPGAHLPVSTIPVLYVQGHLISQCCVILPCVENLAADNQELVL